MPIVIVNKYIKKISFLLVVFIAEPLYVISKYIVNIIVFLLKKNKIKISKDFIIGKKLNLEIKTSENEQYMKLNRDFQNRFFNLKSAN